MLNWAIVGVGDIARKRVLAALASAGRSRIRSAVTTHPDRAREICARYGVERYCTELEEVLTDCDVHAVYVATPVFLHAPQSIAAMAAGKHVLCEKPTALNYEEAVGMVKVAEERGVVFGVSFYRRYYPKVLRLRQLIREGALGRVTLVRAGCHTWVGADDLPGRTWLIEPDKSGGGPLPDIGSHRIDLLNFLFGTPVSVAAEAGTQVQDFAVEDSATLLMQYASGMRAVLDVRWNSRTERDELCVIGTDGEAELTPLNGPTLTIRRGDRAWSEELPASSNLHFPIVDNFVRAVLDGEPLVSTGRTAIETDKVITAAQKAAQSGMRQWL